MKTMLPISDYTRCIILRGYNDQEQVSGAVICSAVDDIARAIHLLLQVYPGTRVINQLSIFATSPAQQTHEYAPPFELGSGEKVYVPRNSPYWEYGRPMLHLGQNEEKGQKIEQDLGWWQRMQRTYEGIVITSGQVHPSSSQEYPIITDDIADGCFAYDTRFLGQQPLPSSAWAYGRNKAEAIGNLYLQTDMGERVQLMRQLIISQGNVLGECITTAGDALQAADIKGFGDGGDLGDALLSILDAIGDNHDNWKDIDLKAL
jgi:hypothetical protein